MPLTAKHLFFYWNLSSVRQFRDGNKTKILSEKSLTRRSVIVEVSIRRLLKQTRVKSRVTFVKFKWNSWLTKWHWSGFALLLIIPHLLHTQRLHHSPTRCNTALTMQHIIITLILRGFISDLAVDWTQSTGALILSVLSLIRHDIE